MYIYLGGTKVSPCELHCLLLWCTRMDGMTGDLKMQCLKKF